jgi:hypothetical protein
MKRFSYYILVIVLLFFSACEIDRAELAYGYDHPAKTMFDLSYQNIIFYSNLLDKVLKLNTYINTPDAQKQQVEDKLLPEFKIRTVNKSDYYLLVAGDTAYTINTNNQNINVPQTIFTIKKQKYYDAVTITNIGTNQWHISGSYIKLLGIVYSTNLNFECSDQTPAESFETNNFTITGDCVFSKHMRYPHTDFKYDITDKITHKAKSKFYVFDKGEWNIMGQNENSDVIDTTFSKFTSEGNSLLVQLLYRSRTTNYQHQYNTKIYDIDEYTSIYY